MSAAICIMRNSHQFRLSLNSYEKGLYFDAHNTTLYVEETKLFFNPVLMEMLITNRNYIRWEKYQFSHFYKIDEFSVAYF